MRTLKPGLIAGGILLAVLAAMPAGAQESWDGPVPARVRHFEGAVTVQRVHAGETGAALINLPLDAGDRIWTEEGRAELTLGDGTLVWLDNRTTVDIVSLAASERGGETLLRAWGGSLIVARREGAGWLRIDAPEGSILLQPDVLARVDVEPGRSWLSVLDGEGRLDAGGVVELLRSGERSYAEEGTAPAQAITFNTSERDAFDGWHASRIAELSRTVEYVRRERPYVPREVIHTVADLEPYGNWFYYDEFDSWAWRPTVTVGWAPYRQGRWVYAYGGWTWVSTSPWGWATSHYGRWHHVPARGWVWFPGRVYSPGWVSWYVGSGYVGWCPIGYYNRPLVSINLWLGGYRGYGYDYHGRSRGYAVERGRAVAGRGYTDGPGDGWNFVRPEDLGRGDVGDRRVVDRTAVRRGVDGGSVTLQGPLRPRDPRVLVASSTPRVATPRLGDGGPVRGATTNPRVAVGRPAGDRPTVQGGPAVRPTTPRAATPRPGSTLPSPRPRGDDSGRVISPRPDGGTGRPAVTPRPSGVPARGGVAPRPSGVPERSVGSPRPSGGPDRSGSVAPRPSGGPDRTGLAPRPSGGPDRVTSPRRPSAGAGRTAPAPRPSAGASRPGLRPSPQGSPTRPAITPRSGSRAPSRPAITPRSGSRAPSRPAITPRSGSRAPSRPAITPRSGSSAPSRPAITPRSGSRAPSRPAITPRAGTGAASRPGITSRGGSARPPSRATGGMSRGSVSRPRPTAPRRAATPPRKAATRPKAKPKPKGGGQD